MTTRAADPTAAELSEYVAASRALTVSRNRIEELASSRVVTAHRAQLDVLQRHLLADPRVFRDMFIADGMQAVAAEFRQPELSSSFVATLWQMLLRDDDASRVLMRFVWNVPLGQKRKFIRGIDAHLSGRYPMFAGLSVGWPAENSIPPYVRPAAERTDDFELVNTGYLGYLQIGYTAREVDLFVWLEAIRDKQCTDSPCELGQLINGHREPKGGYPVQIVLAGREEQHHRAPQGRPPGGHWILAGVNQRSPRQGVNASPIHSAAWRSCNRPASVVPRWPNSRPTCSQLLVCTAFRGMEIPPEMVVA